MDKSVLYAVMTMEPWDMSSDRGQGTSMYTSEESTDAIEAGCVSIKSGETASLHATEQDAYLYVADTKLGSRGASFFIICRSCIRGEESFEWEVRNNCYFSNDCSISRGGGQRTFQDFLR